MAKQRRDKLVAFHTTADMASAIHDAADRREESAAAMLRKFVKAALEQERQSLTKASA